MALTDNRLFVRDDKLVAEWNVHAKAGDYVSVRSLGEHGYCCRIGQDPVEIKIFLDAEHAEKIREQLDALLDPVDSTTPQPTNDELAASTPLVGRATP